MVLDRPVQAFSDLIESLVSHLRIYGDLLFRWGLHHKRLELFKSVSRHLTRRCNTQWHNIGDASS